MSIHLGNIFSKTKGIATKYKWIKNKIFTKKMLPIMCYSY